MSMTFGLSFVSIWVDLNRKYEGAVDNYENFINEQSAMLVEGI
jgi:hypothetical protein